MRFMKRTKHNNTHFESKESTSLSVPIEYRTGEGENMASGRHQPNKVLDE